MVESFEAAVRRWTAKTLRNYELVAKQSFQDVLEIAQTPVAQGGRMRVDTGFLRNSLASALNGSTMLTGADSYILAVGAFELGDVIEAGWTASYARPREYGARGQPPDFFMRNAAQQWQDIVDRNARAVS